MNEKEFIKIILLGKNNIEKSNLSVDDKQKFNEKLDKLIDNLSNVNLNESITEYNQIAMKCDITCKLLVMKKWLDKLKKEE